MADLQNVDLLHGIQQGPFHDMPYIAGQQGVEAAVSYVDHHRVLVRLKLPLHPLCLGMENRQDHGVHRDRVTHPCHPPVGPARIH